MNLSIQVDRIEALNLQPGDVIVVTLPALTDPEQFTRAKKQFQDAFPDHQVLVKTNNVGFDIFHPDGQPVA